VWANGFHHQPAAFLFDENWHGPEGLKDFLQDVTVLGLDEDTCRIFGKERRRLRRAGNLPGDMDLFIGATALRHNLTVLTNNRNHFERIEGLRLESLPSSS